MSAPAPFAAALFAAVEAMSDARAPREDEPATRFRVARQATIELLALRVRGAVDDPRRAMEQLAGRGAPVQAARRAWAALDPLVAATDADRSAAYEQLLTRRPVIDGGALRLAPAGRTRKRAGAWYTPPAVVEPLLAATLAPLWAAAERAADPVAALRGLRVVDPACGTGRFLLAAARQIAGRLQAHGVKPAEARAAGRAAVYGVDLDLGAVTLARLSLDRWAGAPRSPLDAPRSPLDGPQIAVGDALLGALPGQAPPPPLPTDHHGPVHDWSRCAPLAAGGFDAVVGNPPYRAGRLAALRPLAARLRAVCPSAEYQLDPYLLFLDRGARLTRPGGRLGLLVPNSWMSNHRAGRLRALLLGDHRLEALLEVPAEAFDAVVETAIGVWTIGAGPTAGPVTTTGLDGQPTGALLVDPATPGAPLPLVRTARARQIVEQARGWSLTLGHIAEVTRGVNPYHHTTHRPEQIAARVHHADHQIDPSWSPELRGRDLPGPYHLGWRGDHWIHYGPWLKEPRHPRFFEGPRLLVRKILGPTLCGVFVDRPLYCDQSVYIARMKPEQPYPPWAVLACVNSEVIATLLKARHQEHDRHFPQLKVRELRGLPLPPAPPDDPRWATLADDARHAQAHDGATRRAAIEAQVCALYGVAVGHREASDATAPTSALRRDR